MYLGPTFEASEETERTTVQLTTLQLESVQEEELPAPTPSDAASLSASPSTTSLSSFSSSTPSSLEPSPPPARRQRLDAAALVPLLDVPTENALTSSPTAIRRPAIGMSPLALQRALRILISPSHDLTDRLSPTESPKSALFPATSFTPTAFYKEKLEGKSNFSQSASNLLSTDALDLSLGISEKPFGRSHSSQTLHSHFKEQQSKRKTKFNRLNKALRPWDPQQNCIAQPLLRKWKIQPEAQIPAIPRVDDAIMGRLLRGPGIRYYTVLLSEQSDLLLQACKLRQDIDGSISQWLEPTPPIKFSDIPFSERNSYSTWVAFFNKWGKFEIRLSATKHLVLCGFASHAYAAGDLRVDARGQINLINNQSGSFHALASSPRDDSADHGLKICQILGIPTACFEALNPTVKKPKPY